jgi:hypothetical protein
MSDFRVPSENLTIPGGVSYQPVIRSIGETEASAQRTVRSISKESMQSLSNVATANQMAAAQADLLALTDGLNDKAEQLGASGNMQPVYSMTEDENGQQAKNISGWQLGDDWDKALAEGMDTLTKKYQNFPKVQEWALNTYRERASEANLHAYDAAYKYNLEQGKTEVETAAGLAAKTDIANGNTKVSDALFSAQHVKDLLGPGALAKLQASTQQTIRDGILAKNLDQTVKTQGLDAAAKMLDAAADITPAQRATFEEGITRQDALEQHSAEQQIITVASKLMQQGAPKDDAMNQAAKMVPDFRAPKALENVNKILDFRQNQFDETSLRNLDGQIASSLRGEISLNDVIKAWSAKDIAGGMSHAKWKDGLDTLYSIRDQQMRGESAENIANTIPQNLLLLASDTAPQKIDKGQQFMEARRKGIIDNKQLEYLLGHRVDSNPYLDQQKRVMASWGEVNAVTGEILIPKEQSIMAQQMLDEAFRQESIASKGNVTPEKVKEMSDQIKGLITDPIINKAVGKMFQTQGLVGQIFMGPRDQGAIDDFQGKIQRGEVADIAGTEQFKDQVKVLRQAQQGILRDKRINVQSKAAQGANGQQFYYDDQGRIFTYLLDAKGRGAWLSAPSAKPPKTFAQWTELK